MLIKWDFLSFSISHHFQFTLCRIAGNCLACRRFKSTWCYCETPVSHWSISCIDNKNTYQQCATTNLLDSNFIWLSNLVASNITDRFIIYIVYPHFPVYGSETVKSSSKSFVQLKKTVTCAFIQCFTVAKQQQQPQHQQRISDSDQWHWTIRWWYQDWPFVYACVCVCLWCNLTCISMSWNMKKSPTKIRLISLFAVALSQLSGSSSISTTKKNTIIPIYFDTNIRVDHVT